jgi:exopolysaccharide biosynthesis protein
MTLDELAAEMIAAGAVTALNLDGGGSTTLVARDRETGKLKIQNSPSDTKDRSVADALGISVKD